MLTDASAMSQIAQAHANGALFLDDPFNRDVVARAGPTFRHHLPIVELIDDAENSPENRRIVDLAYPLRHLERETWPPTRDSGNCTGDLPVFDPSSTRWRSFANARLTSKLAGAVKDRIRRPGKSRSTQFAPPRRSPNRRSSDTSLSGRGRTDNVSPPPTKRTRRCKRENTARL